MALQPIEQTEIVAANKLAERIVADITQLGTRVKALRDNGVPAQPAQAERTLEDGRVIPARPAIAAVSADAINKALGDTNCAVLDGLAKAIGIAST